MAGWGWFIAVFVGMWLLQIVLTIRQSNHYQRQLRELRQQLSGFLGVGVHKRKFGSGAVVILVTDDNGVVTRCKEMTGVTVFARFREVSERIGKSLDECRIAEPRTPKQFALNMAIDKIQEERLKKEQEQVSAQIG